MYFTQTHKDGYASADRERVGEKVIRIEFIRVGFDNQTAYGSAVEKRPPKA